MNNLLIKKILLVIYLSCQVGVVSAEEIAYQVNPGDVIKVFVWNEESLSGEFVVRPDGVISMPMAGQIKVGGQTPVDIENSITSGLTKYLRDKPVVTVSLLRLDGNIIYVLGKVNRPGAFPVGSRIDITQALALAGGLNSFADENSIRVLRRGNSGVQNALPFNYEAVKNGKKLESNIILHSGDVVVVP